MRILSKVTAFFASFVLLAGLCGALADDVPEIRVVGGHSVTLSSQPVLLDGEESDISAYNIDGCNYFKLRDLAALLAEKETGFSVETEEESYTIVLTTQGGYEPRGDELGALSSEILSLTDSVWKLKVNGIGRPVSAFNIDGSNYYKLADLGRVLGFGVSYDASAGCVLLDSGLHFSIDCPLCDPVDSSWFDDTAFVGDSVSGYLRYYAGDAGLGNAVFLQAASLSATNALWEVSSQSVHPSYMGTKMKIEDAIALSDVKNVVIMLGGNDIGYGEAYAVETYTKLLDLILEKAPEVQLYIESVLPMTAASTRADAILNNESIRQFNDDIRQLCEERGWYYLDIYSIFSDENGYMIDAFCGDNPNMGMHPTYEAVGLWVDYLRTHVPAV